MKINLIFTLFSLFHTLFSLFKMRYTRNLIQKSNQNFLETDETGHSVSVNSCCDSC